MSAKRDALKAAAYAEFQRMKRERKTLGPTVRRTPFDDLELTMDEFAAEVDAITYKTSTLPRAQREFIIWCTGKALAELKKQ